jgi:hypothetical protein
LVKFRIKTSELKVAVRCCWYGNKILVWENVLVRAPETFILLVTFESLQIIPKGIGALFQLKTFSDG